MVKKDELLRIFAGPVRKLLQEAAPDWEKVQEIRMRTGRPVFVVSGGREYVLTADGLRETAGAGWLADGLRAMPAPGPGETLPSGSAGAADRKRPRVYLATQQDMRETLEYVGSHSLYAFEEEIRQGFITISGGHRIGLAGKTVLDERGIRTIKYISFLNVRLAHQVRGCADKVMPYLFENGQALHALFVSPPRCGKTTLLRDVIRQMSDGYAGCASAAGSCRAGGFTVGVVDERSELAACCQGIPQNDLGARTDVLDCCPKARGMMMLVRAMSPDVIAVDEIGGREDIDAVRYVMNCGCRVLATVHGDSTADVARKPVLGEMVSEGMFDRYIILSGRGGAGTLEEIRDKTGKRLYPEGAVEAGSGVASGNRKRPGQGGGAV